MEPPPLESLIPSLDPTASPTEQPAPTSRPQEPQPDRSHQATLAISKLLGGPSPQQEESLTLRQNNGNDADEQPRNGEILVKNDEDDEDDHVQPAVDAVEKLVETRPEATMLEQMMAAAGAARKMKAKEKAKEMEAREKSFGSSLKGGFRAAMDKRKDDLVVANAFKTRGNQALKEGKAEMAVEYYTKALKLDPESKVFYSNRSLALLKLGKKEEARKDAEKSIALDPDWPKGYLRKASALIAEGNSTAAAKCYETCLNRECVRKDNRQKKSIESLYARDLPEAFRIYSLPVVKSTTSQDKDLRLEEVQEAMQADAVEQLKSGAWVNDGFVKKLTANPKLAKALADPTFSSILQSMQKDPVETMKALQAKPEAKEIVTELLKLVGDHFSSLDTKQPREVPHIVPAEESKLQHEANKVLEDSEVRTILEDPETRRVLEMCGNPVCLAQYMRHPTWGPRIRLLQQKGLVQFQN